LDLDLLKLPRVGPEVPARLEAVAAVYFAGAAVAEVVAAYDPWAVAPNVLVVAAFDSVADRPVGRLTVLMVSPGPTAVTVAAAVL